MPSPIGHALGGLAAGWAVSPPEHDRRALITQSAIFMCLGAAADLDLLIGRHHYEMHSVGAALLAGVLAAWMRWPVGSSRWRIFLAATAAWASHPLLDMLAPDHSPPIGVMAFWPFSRGFFITGIEIFMPISRQWWRAGVLAFDARAAVREVLILAPLVGLVWWLRRRTSRSRGRSSGPGVPRSPSA